jgi:alpha-galactosidase
MKIVIIGAGSIAFTPSLISGFATDQRYRGATIGFVDVNNEPLDLVARVARRASNEFGMDWKIEASTDRREVLPGADLVTAAIGVGGVDAWELDVGIPYKHGFIQPVGDTAGPGGLFRALRHIPVLVAIGKDMEQLCPGATFYNFTNPLTVLTHAVNSLTRTRCVGLCVGPDLTWDHVCRVVGVEKKRTSAVLGGLNHVHWLLDFRIDGKDAMPVLAAALDELEGDGAKMEAFRTKYGGLAKRPQEPQGSQPLCVGLFRQFGAYPGPGDGHVAEFFPQLIRSTVKNLDHFQGEAIRYVRESYPKLTQKMKALADGSSELNTEVFAREMAWEHTQLLGILVSQQDNLNQTYYVNIPNRGHIHNLPDGVPVEIPARVDAAGLHPYALGDLPKSLVPALAQRAAVLEIIIEAAMEGSRRKAVQALANDAYCTDLSAAERCVDELLKAEAKYLPSFR